MAKKEYREDYIGREQDNPSYKDLKAELEIERDIKEEISYIRSMIDNPRIDPNGIQDPLVWEERLVDLKDKSKKIGDVSVVRDIEKKISVLKQSLYKLYIPYLESKINLFRENTLQEVRDKMEKKIMEYFDRAILEIDKVGRSSLKMEISDLKYKFELYKKEPTFFKFEQDVKQLRKDAEKLEEDVLLRATIVLTENMNRLNDLTRQVVSLQSIAQNMKSKDIKSYCEEKVNYIFRILENVRERISASRRTENSRANFFEAGGNKLTRAFSVLGLEVNSPKDVIKKRYHELARQNHPDVNKSPDALRKMQEITEAYDTIRKALGFK